ncbi:acyltransferase family protein [Actinokineospora sp. 24-640]
MSWDVVRVVAVLGVVVGHITRQAPLNHPELGPFPIHLPVLFGANTLLVVSAFFVCVTVRRGRTARWLGHRLARLLPPYFAALLVTFAVLRWFAPKFGWYAADLTDLASNLLLVQAWSPDFHWVDGSYWTLPAQVLAFLCAALLWPREWLRGPVAMATLLWALVVVPLLLRFLVIHADSPQWMRSTFDGLTLHRAALFGVGVAVWLWTRERMSGQHLAAYGAAVLIALELHTQFVDTASTIAFGFALIALAMAAGGPDWKVGPLARPITWLAGISFGVYLVHQELGYVLARLLVDAGVGPVGRFVLCLAMAVLLGWALTRAVERPVHAWLTGAGFTEFAARARAGVAALAAALREVPQTPQPQGPSVGGSPVSASAGPRPVSQPKTAAVVPLTAQLSAPARANSA